VTRAFSRRSTRCWPQEKLRCTELQPHHAIETRHEDGRPRGRRDNLDPQDSPMRGQLQREVSTHADLPLVRRRSRQRSGSHLDRGEPRPPSTSPVRLPRRALAVTLSKLARPGRSTACRAVEWRDGVGIGHHIEHAGRPLRERTIDAGTTSPGRRQPAWTPNALCALSYGWGSLVPPPLFPSLTSVRARTSHADRLLMTTRPEDRGAPL